MISGHEAAMLSFQAIHAALAASDKTKEPMNALVVWTELGKGLSGTLERKGASPGLLLDIITEYCVERGAQEGVDLSRWAYYVPPERRLSATEIGAAMRRVTRELEERLPELAAEAESATEKERDLFLALVRGWFPVGLDILRAMPGGESAEDADRLGALAGFCRRYLPADTSGPRDLGVRAVREEQGPA